MTVTYWRGSMKYGLKWRIRNHSLIKRSFLSNVLYDGKVKLVLADIWICLLDFVGFRLGPNSGHYGMATLEKAIYDVCCNKAATTWVGG